MSRAILFLWTLIAIFLTTSSSRGQESSPPYYLLTNARIFDVETGTLADSTRTILIAGNTIEDINSSSGASGVPSIDLGGRVVLPGLIDLHSHLLLHPYDEATWNDQVLKESLGLRTIRGTLAAKATLHAGFTTLRDLGTEGAEFADVAIRDAINQGLIPGPRIIVVTKALVTTGGYGPSGFDPRWRMPVGAQTADGVAECRKVTREQIAAGADWIKVYADYRRRPGDRSTPTFSQEELNAIVSEAKSAGVSVAAHATTDEGIRRSIKAGVKTIEHGYEASLATLQMMDDFGVVLCPTLTASESMARYNGWNPKNDPDPARITTARILMKNALKSGVTIACGSDVGVFPHGDNVRELELLYAYGMTAEDVIRSATITAASVLDQDRLGRIKPGMLADLIVVDENPVTDLATLKHPVVVIKDGKIAVNRLPKSHPTADAGTSVPTEETNNDASAKTGLSDKLRIIEITELSDNNSMADPLNTKADGAGETKNDMLKISLQPGGSFQHRGKTISPGDLARLIAVNLESGKKDVLVVVSKPIDYQVLINAQQWLEGLGIETVYLESR